MDAIALLRKVPYFAPAASEPLAALARHGRTQQFDRGQFLFHLGEPTTRLFVIADGRVAAMVSSPQGTPVMFHVASVGETPGHISVLDGANHTASAQALSTVTTLALPAAAVRELLEAEPTCLLRFATDLADIVRILTESVADLVFLDLEQRLARLLVDSTSVGDRIHLSLTQAEMAARLGVARQSLNRALSRLVDRGFVAVESRRVIQILDRPALTALVNRSRR